MKPQLDESQDSSAGRVIQLIKPIAQIRYQIHNDYGLRLIDYVPDSAYLDKIQSVTLDRLSRLL